MINPMVSVVIPAYNASKMITETLESVANQTYSNYEVIIVDDCSTDNTYDICKAYCSKSEKFRIIKTKSNFGCPGGPRNLGVKNATGKYVAFLDADDLWHRNKLEFQVNEALKLNCNFLSTNMSRFDNSIDFDSGSVLSVYRVIKISYISQLLNYQTPTSSVLVKRSLLISNPFQEEIEFKAREDIDCWLRIHKEVGFSHKLMLPLMGYRVCEGQISGDKLKMIKSTFYCYQNTDGIENKLLNFVPVLATCTHFLRGFFNRIFKRGI